MAVNSTSNSTNDLGSAFSDGYQGDDLNKQAQRTSGGAGTKSARQSLEDTNFTPRSPANSATLNFQVFGFGDLYTRNPVNPKNIDTPFSVLHTFVDQNLVTFGNPTPGSGIPTFVTIPVNQHGLSVGGTITGATPGGFAVVTPPGLVIPKPFAVTYADLDGNVGAITGIWSVNQIAGPFGFTVGARLIANANISGFLNDLDPTPRDLDSLASGGPVEKTYLQLQGYDQHGTLMAMGINSLQNYKDTIAGFSRDGGFNLPVEISGLAWKPEDQALSVDLVNRQVASHLVDQMSIVNDVDGSQTAGQAQIELNQVNQRIDVIKIELESIAGTVNPEVLGDVAVYESELKDLKAKQQVLEEVIKKLPAKHSHDVYSPEKVLAILTHHSRNQELAFVNLGDKINTTKQQIDDAKHRLARTMDRDEIQALEQNIPQLEMQIDLLESQKTLISSSWRPDISSEAYAATQALAATNAKIDSIEKTLVEMSKEPIGMPLNEWQQQANFELEKSILADLTTLNDDSQKLQAWLQANTALPVARQEPPLEKMSSPPLPASKPLDRIPTHLPSPSRPDVTDQVEIDSTTVDPVSEPAIGFEQTLANDFRSWGQGFMDLGSAVKSHYQTQMSQPKEHYSILEKRDFDMFGRPGESLHEYTQRAKK